MRLWGGKIKKHAKNQFRGYRNKMEKIPETLEISAN